MSDFTFFYGGPFSQWAHSDFVIDGKTYLTAEQWMMAEKARVFGDEEIRKKILATRDPREQKALGRQVKNFDPNKWNAVSRDIVYKGSYAKFKQNNFMQEVLLKTKGTLLVEASPTDCLWGIGLSADNPDAQEQSKWRGVNWLGEVLTKVRNDMEHGVERTENFEWSDKVHVYKQPPPI